MTFVIHLLNTICQAVFLFTFFGGVMGVLLLTRWSFETAKQTQKKRKNTAQRTNMAAAGGQSLGRASAAELQSARMARLHDNRLQMQATMAREAKRAITKPRRTDSSRSGPTLYPPKPAVTSSRSASPTSVLQVPNSKLPQELCPEATKHFFMNGAIKFIALPTTVMKNSDVAVTILRRVADEFMPIIRKHNFNVRSVSEMCCCGDGLEYELGGERRSVPAGELIVGNDHDLVAGYNGKLMNNFGKPEHVIHLRLRKVEGHAQFMDYEEIVDTMAHELSHCIHEDHGPEFWELMGEILEDRAKIVEDLKAGKKTLHNDPVKASKEQFSGFNIYQPSMGQMRNYNMGQRARKDA
mgnify:CR=1 FL=1